MCAYRSVRSFVVIHSRVEEVCTENSLNCRPKFTGKFHVMVRNCSLRETMEVIIVIVVKLWAEEGIGMAADRI